MAHGLATKSPYDVKKQVEDNWWFWFPIVAGVATKEEMEKATSEEVQIFNKVAELKQQMQQPRGGDGE
ncbi:hypothetical protein [Ligilactobacillus equi]|uniref:Uncharacterized protein n=1 Tax=Ligilactobacillus equi DSM 15833 = JCM 10991 TaxID=1423740 RepID=A0A0R1TTJ9_9LACO|nr:hypothetical protein [Ligilactobacillus equi]KRL81810.1 hypothetical protein FC36_GL001405 [Ligilactobacillus equi DSM 15833 = JCM 10991]